MFLALVNDSSQVRSIAVDDAGVLGAEGRIIEHRAHLMHEIARPLVLDYREIEPFVLHRHEVGIRCLRCNVLADHGDVCGAVSDGTCRE